jgi:hypothetical protein
MPSTRGGILPGRLAPGGPTGGRIAGRSAENGAVVRGLINKTFVARVFQNRLVLFLGLFAIQMQFFTINFLNSRLLAPTYGWELKIEWIDNHLTPHAVWLVPYMLGFFLAALVPLWAVYHMPNTLYRQFILAMAVAALFSYMIYIVFPTYVTKPSPGQVHGNGLFTHLLRFSYELDDAASTHNAAPSQHVFYAILNMCFMIRFRPRLRVFVAWIGLAALITASTLLTMRHRSPDLISGYAVAVGAYYMGLYLGRRVTAWLGDAEDPIRAPRWPYDLRVRIARRLARNEGEQAR